MLAAARIRPSAGRSGYLLRDLFTTTAGAPLTTPRTCEPGPGQLDITALNNSAPNISGGLYVEPHATTGQAYASLGFLSHSSFVRTPGLTCYALVRSSRLAGLIPVSFSPTQAVGQNVGYGLNFAGTASIQLGKANIIVSSGPLAINTFYQVATVCRPQGYLHFLRGGAFTNWTLMWVEGLGFETPLWLEHANFDSAADFDTITVLRKGGGFTSQYGKAFLYQPVLNNGDTFTGQADGLTYVGWTPGTGETLSIYFRRTDDNNTYRIDCAQTGGTIKLFRRSASVDTELAAGQTQTWDVTKSYRIGIMHAGGEIRTFVEEQATAGSVAKHAVTGESFNLAVAGVKIAGVSSAYSLEVWPRTFSGTTEVDLA